MSSTGSAGRRGSRPPLSAERVVDAAVRVADEGGLARVSMRNVAAELGVEAMSLYHHVASKEALLDALADWVFTQIDVPAPRDPWREAMRERAASARRVLAAHPWALGLIESRTPGPALLTHHDSVLGCLRANGFTVVMATHAFSAIDAYVYGFVLTEQTVPFAAGQEQEYAVGIEDQLPADRYPHLAEMLREQVIAAGFEFADEFDFGLEIILDGLERRLETGRPGS
ncbi:TetR family transcriptional regulator [Nostocoides sp. F2B08]|uniref:TetR/AcrR family transcriptional regulator n=1 Tax=Nostocoides sp. F2B08 TaxID=2653936 RepID=UPI001262FBCB|nr:TetR/AcrR family transcriptional regulator [Tetrasphaera sp. F2B08]KAB7745300.1 TetR family transcriptional regulator [Tetrasphaera sp. F2B08]